MALRRSDITVPPLRKPTAEEIDAGAAPDELVPDGVPESRVDRALSQLNSGERKLKGPKSEAGRRKVALPVGILPELRHHLDTKGFADPGADG